MKPGTTGTGPAATAGGHRLRRACGLRHLRAGASVMAVGGHDVHRVDHSRGVPAGDGRRQQHRREPFATRDENRGCAARGARGCRPPPDFLELADRGLDRQGAVSPGRPAGPRRTRRCRRRTAARSAAAVLVPLRMVVGVEEQIGDTAQRRRDDHQRARVRPDAVAAVRRRRLGERRAAELPDVRGSGAATGPRGTRARGRGHRVPNILSWPRCWLGGDSPALRDCWGQSRTSGLSPFFR